MTEPNRCPQAADLRDLPAAQLLEFGGGTADPEKKQVDARRLLSLGSCHLPRSGPPAGSHSRAPPRWALDSFSLIDLDMVQLATATRVWALRLHTIHNAA